MASENLFAFILISMNIFTSEIFPLACAETATPPLTLTLKIFLAMKKTEITSSLIKSINICFRWFKQSKYSGFTSWS